MSSWSISIELPKYSISIRKKLPLITERVRSPGLGDERWAERLESWPGWAAGSAKVSKVEFYHKI